MRSLQAELTSPAHHTVSASARQNIGVSARRAYWSWALLLIVAVFLTRLVYLIWLCPYELVGDEGYYWEQSRHLDLSYNEKGPALPWLIAASCRVFGDKEWAVRLPVLLSFVIGAWGVGKLAMIVARGNERAGLLAVICYFLMPAFQANAQISTQDGPIITLWVALSAVGLRLIHRWRMNQNTWRDWISLWAVLGIATLFKQSALLFLISVAIYALVERRRLSWNFSLILQQIAGVIAFGLVISPMIYWNWMHGWPMLAHTAGHLGLGGDQAGVVQGGNAGVWLLNTVGGIVGAFGPAAVILMISAGLLAWKRRTEDPDRWASRFWLMCSAWPSVLFFVALSFVKPVVPSWPLTSLAPLMVLVAELLNGDIYSGERSAVSSAHNVRLRQLWSVTVIYGLVGWLVISFPTFLARLPLVGKVVQHRIDEISGHRRDAAELQAVIEQVTRSQHQTPIIVARQYWLPGLYSFYLPGHPTVSMAGKYLGKRLSNFDHWDDTRLDNPALYGRPLVLCGNGKVTWDRALIFDHLQTLEQKHFFLALNYQGPRPDHPKTTAEND